jgi:DNA-binding MarR family transcriptional regulator
MNNPKIYGFEMARISEVYLSSVSSIMKPLGLERHFAAVLFICRNSGEITQTEIANYLKKDKVCTMRIIDYLSEKGLIERIQHKNDRRCHLIMATEKGMALALQIELAIEQTNDILFNNFTTHEIEIFKTGMDKLFQTIRTLPEPDFVIEAYKRNANSN